MLKMIIQASSNPGDLVLDCFAGSGTTLDAAFNCDRLWIGVDNSLESVKAVLKRFMDGLDIYGDYVGSGPQDSQISLELQEKCSFHLLTTAQLRDKLNSVYHTSLK